MKHEEADEIFEESKSEREAESAFEYVSAISVFETNDAETNDGYSIVSAVIAAGAVAVSEDERPFDFLTFT